MDNRPWSLESFVDSLVVELDKTRETLAVKSVNKPLSYTVKDMALELQIFPSFDGDDVRFVTAQPGESGASKISLQLASITDQQVRATSKLPAKGDDVSIETVEVDDKTKKELRRLGVTSVGDLEQIEKRGIDLGKVAGGGGKLDYGNLANLIRKARRDRNPPQIGKVTMSQSADGEPLIRIEGRNLASPGHEPVAVLNNRLGAVVDYGPGHLAIRPDPATPLGTANDLILTLDPYCIARLELRRPGSQDRVTP